MKQEISTYDKQRASKLTELILECGYAVMLTKEEGLYIINFIEASDFYKISEDGEANRNNVVFMTRDEFEDSYFSQDNTQNEY